MEYIGVKEAAEVWCLTARMVLYHCTNGRRRALETFQSVVNS